MSKKILIINGHPRKDSLNFALAEAYKKGAEISGAELKMLNVVDLKIDWFNTAFDNSKTGEAIKSVQELIAWADHTVWVYPIWWYTLPALMKAFMEQVLLSGFAFKYLKSEKVVKWDKFLNGKTARIISTMDAPPWYYKLFVGDPGYKTMKAALGFCGFKTIKRTYFGPVKFASDAQIKKWIAELELLGKRLT